MDDDLCVTVDTGIDSNVVTELMSHPTKRAPSSLVGQPERICCRSYVKETLP